MRVRLTRKLAEAIDGIDLSAHHVGEVIDLADASGRMLIAEEWAIAERRFTVLPFRKRDGLARRADDHKASRAS